MQAVIMAGGKGTRLVSLTKDLIPKPMALLAGKPILEWQIWQLKANGIKDVIMAVGHLAEKIMDYFGDGSRFGINIRYYHEKEPMGSAGCLYHIKEMLDEGPFFMVFGDILFDIDMERMERFHREKGAEATLFVHPNSHPFDSDLVVMDASNRITDFDSKNNDRSGYWYDNCVNAGLYLLDKTFCGRIENPVKTDLEKDILIHMARRGEKIFGYATPEYVKDIGTPERIAVAESELESGIVRARNLKNKQKAVFLDRDGTINVYKGLVWKEEDFELLPNAAEAIGKLNRSGYLALVITNQPVVARGLCGIEDVEKIHNKMKTLLGKEGVFLDGISFCPHHPDKGYPEENPLYKVDCSCRKPKTGMIEEFVVKYNIDLSQSWVIGDTTIDIRTGKNAGIQTALVLTGESGYDGKFNDKPDYVYTDILEAVQEITSKARRG